jgi:hypothetical protein
MSDLRFSVWCSPSCLLWWSFLYLFQHTWKQIVLETRNNNFWFCLPFAKLSVDVFRADGHRSNWNVAESHSCVSCMAWRKFPMRHLLPVSVTYPNHLHVCLSLLPFWFNQLAPPIFYRHLPFLVVFSCKSRVFFFWDTFVCFLSLFNNAVNHKVMVNCHGLRGS